MAHHFLGHDVNVLRRFVVVEFEISVRSLDRRLTRWANPRIRSHSCRQRAIAREKVEKNAHDEH
jgi:hypothetical protein